MVKLLEIFEAGIDFEARQRRCDGIDCSFAITVGFLYVNEVPTFDALIIRVVGWRGLLSQSQVTVYGGFIAPA